MKDIDVAYDRMLKGDVKYRFVIDMNSLRDLQSDARGDS